MKKLQNILIFTALLGAVSCTNSPMATIEGTITEAEIQFAQAAIEKLDAANAKQREKQAEKAKENEPIVASILATLTNDPQTAADIGIAGGDGCAMLFKSGEIVGKIPEDKIIEVRGEEYDEPHRWNVPVDRVIKVKNRYFMIFSEIDKM